MREEAHENVVTFAPVSNQRQEVLEVYRQQKQVQQRTIAMPTRPEREAPDERTWFGIMRESTQLKRHHAQMFTTYFAERHASFAINCAMALEYHGLTGAIHTIDAEQKELELTEPDSLAHEVGLQLFIESAARIQTFNGEVQEAFRRKALGTS